MGDQQSSVRNIAFFAALFSTALALGAALAHALEFPNKIGLAREPYFTIQQIYSGWSLLGLLLVVELAAMLAVILLYRHDRPVMRPAVFALLCLVAAQAVFWTFTFPANAATSNWTVQPADWEKFRSQWEYSHMVGALFQAGAMAALIVGVLRRSKA